MRILEEFWYGTIEPIEYDTSPVRSTRNHWSWFAGMKKSSNPAWQTNRKNCSLAIQIPFVCTRWQQIAWYSRTVLSWVPEWCWKSWKN